ncbi:cytidylyltransferase domain-containing protein [Profundibacter sp.]
MTDPVSTSLGATACVILARGGSKGILGKNLQKLGGGSLIGRSVRAAVAAPSVAAVYVSTDDDAIAAEARLHGARIIVRPDDISGDGASSEAGWLHAIPEMRSDFPDLDRLVFLQCTSPFTTGQDIENCLAEMEKQGTDCALSVIEDHSFLWQNDASGRGRGVNHDETRQRQRRQDLAPSFRESGAIYCVNAAAFERVGRRFCGTVALCPVDHPAVEIDTPADLALCAQIATTSGFAGINTSSLLNIRAVVMDFDGVHTDNLVSTDQNGIEAVRTSRGDGMGLSMLRDAGRWQLMILSKERNPVVLKRAEKLKIEVHHSVDDKVAALEIWLSERGLDWDALLYIGNDVNDAAAMARAGVSACPSDAHPEILAIAGWILPYPGGKGALRAMCDTLLDQGA